MIEIAPTRFLLVIPSGTPVEKVELALIDLIEEARTSAPGEVGLLETLREKFAGLRRKDKVSKAEVLLVDV